MLTEENDDDEEESIKYHDQKHDIIREIKEGERTISFFQERT